jgi:hypothetical protein
LTYSNGRGVLEPCPSEYRTACQFVEGGSKEYLVKTSSSIVVICLLFSISSGCGGKSPSDTLKNTLLKANEGKYSEAQDALSSEVKKLFEGEMSKLVWDSITKQRTIKSVEVGKEQVRGEGATVSLKIVYKDGSSIEAEEEMIKEDGKWKSSFLGTMDAAKNKRFNLRPGAGQRDRQNDAEDDK